MTITLRTNPNHKNTTNVLQVITEMYYNYLPQSHCKASSKEETVHFVKATCSQIHYTIQSINQRRCELFLNVKYFNYITIFYVEFYKCPMGFSFHINTGKCDH